MAQRENLHLWLQSWAKLARGPSGQRRGGGVVVVVVVVVASRRYKPARPPAVQPFFSTSPAARFA